MTYCCAIESMLFVNQYKTRPDGNVANSAVKMNGKNKNIFCWVASVGAGFNFCCMYIEIPIAIGSIK